MIFGGRRLRRWGLGVCALVCAAGLSASVAVAEDEGNPEPPVFNGFMNFQTIHGPADPEVFVWRVNLHGGQELVQIDERSAEVLHLSGNRAFLISAEQARDATGAEVPTSLEVVGPDLVSLTVYHRDGNPAKDRAPYWYPVTPGPPYEAGYSRVAVIMPPPETDPVTPPPPCVVPRLTARTLPGARARLASAGCTLGKVRGERSKGARVRKQFRQPGTVLASGARVAVKLG